ncbi:hypothetical protein [Niabella ginsengisoli]|uniref:Sodium:solute symporter n=1 Tax=Niabella ginsengisoli TaxID=522298 RepID=A0ABS9SIC0_9BACT|nr:hypothetical protein [Niabella ginsengisoli]MCH5598056.1 hypothetical protein [Niabella ginsengisoli]
MLNNLDLGISIFYILGILAVGLWAGISHRRKSKSNAAGDYFLAGKSLKWPAIGWPYLPLIYQRYTW